jgi:transcriptional regulator with XRE-family HTH domain
MKEKTPLGWGARFRESLKAKGLSLGQLARELDLAESTLRSWTNGTRDINLSDFLRLCAAAQIDPAFVLFAGKVDAKFLVIGEAWNKASQDQKGVLWTAAQGILAQHEQPRRRGAGTG